MVLGDMRRSDTRRLTNIIGKQAAHATEQRTSAEVSQLYPTKQFESL